MADIDREQPVLRNARMWTRVEIFQITFGQQLFQYNCFFFLRGGH